MFSIKVRLHSLIDVITNSSTEIFTSVTSSGKENLYKIIQEIMTTLKVEGNAEDFFTVTVEEVINYDYLTDQLYDGEEFEEFYEDYPEYKELETYREKETFLGNLGIDKLRNYDLSFNYNSDQVEEEFIIRSKETGERNEVIEDALTSLFYSEEEEYN